MLINNLESRSCITLGCYVGAFYNVIYCFHFNFFHLLVGSRYMYMYVWYHVFCLIKYIGDFLFNYALS